METIYIRLQKPPSGANHARSIDGRAAAKNWEKLKVFAEELQAKPLDAFFGNDSSGGNWYSPTEALATLHQLLKRINRDKRGMDDVRLLIRDLNSYENILSSAKARGSKFRFTARQDFSS